MAARINNLEFIQKYKDFLLEKIPKAFLKNSAKVFFILKVKRYLL